MHRVDQYVGRLRQTFRTAPDKHAAHERSRGVMVELARDGDALGAILERHLRRPGALDRGNYPVLAFDIDSNPWFHLVANAWIPHPENVTDLSTKAIHHHGTMLLTTVTAFGPGYEHWLFTPPRPLDVERGLYAMELTERGVHGLHEAAFVDAGIAHLPMFPPDLTITYCLWSSRAPKTWRDTLKRVPVLHRNAALLRRLVTRAGLDRALEVKNVELFDFHPSPEGFVGMREREEFARGPNADYLHSLAYVLQRTGNEGLAPALRSARPGDPVAEDLAARLERGQRVDPRLSTEHYTVPYSNFPPDAIEEALAAAMPARV